MHVYVHILASLHLRTYINILLSLICIYTYTYLSIYLSIYLSTCICMCMHLFIHGLTNTSGSGLPQGGGAEHAHQNQSRFNGPPEWAPNSHRKDCCGVYIMDENRQKKPYNSVFTKVLQYIMPHQSLFCILLDDCLQAPCSRTRLWP